MNPNQCQFPALFAALALSFMFHGQAQAADGQCIVAGRLNAAQQWAPRFAGIELLTREGGPVVSSAPKALAAVRQVRISRAALLAACDGEQELATGPAIIQDKSAVPAVSAGKMPIAVEAVAYPRLRAGGSLVELRLALPAERVVTMTR